MPKTIGAISAIVLTLAMAACVSEVPPTSPPTGSASSPTATVATATPVVTPEPTVESSTCIISSPAQFGTDMTPVVMSIPGASADVCAGYLKTSAAGSTLLEAVPAGDPVCDLTVKGIRFIVYGTAAAQYVCAALPTS